MQKRVKKIGKQGDKKFLHQEHVKEQELHEKEEPPEFAFSLQKKQHRLLREEGSQRLAALPGAGSLVALLRSSSRPCGQPVAISLTPLHCLCTKREVIPLV